jgi:hypothetical protein
MMIDVIRSLEMSVLVRVTQSHIREDGFLQGKEYPSEYVFSDNNLP